MKPIKYSMGDSVGVCTFMHELAPIVMNGSGEPKRAAMFRCVCGNEFAAMISHVKKGQCCGCIRKATVSRRQTTHGISGTKAYKTWKGVKKRCYSKNEPSFDLYGGRGITMQESWINNPVAFCSYVMGLDGYELAKISENQISLDRINVDGNYEEGNLRWVGQEIQVRNRRIQRNNTSGFAGVFWIERLGKFQARVSRKHLGYAPTALEAVQLRIDYIKSEGLQGYNV